MDLEKLFSLSKPAALPEVAVASLQKIEPLVAEDPEEPTEKPLSRREKARAMEEPEDRLKRTIFVGNLPVEICKSKAMQRALKKKFAAHGKLVSIRFRSIGFSKAMPRKIAYATQQFHEERDSVNAYIVMEQEEDAKKAVVENASVFEGHHLRVDVAAADRKNDTKKSIFVGNLALSITEETLWEFFSTCGPINNVRVIRDKKTNLGKGFGYVAFADKASIELALQLAGTECGGRPIRIAKCTKEGFHKETQVFKEKRKNGGQEASADATATATAKPFQGNQTRQFQGKQTTQYQGKQTSQYQGKQTSQYQGKQTSHYQGKQTSQYQGKQTSQYQGRQTSQYQGRQTSQYQGAKPFQGRQTSQFQGAKPFNKLTAPTKTIVKKPTQSRPATRPTDKAQAAPGKRLPTKVIKPTERQARSSK